MTPFEFVITPGNDVGNYHRSYISVSVTVVLTRRAGARSAAPQNGARDGGHKPPPDISRPLFGVQQAVGRAAPGTPRRVRHAGLPAVAGPRCPPLRAGAARASRCPYEDKVGS